MSDRCMTPLNKLHAGDVVNYVHRPGDKLVFHVFPTPDGKIIVKYISEDFPKGTPEIGDPDFKVFVKSHRRLPKNLRARISESLWSLGR